MDEQLVMYDCDHEKYVTCKKSICYSRGGMCHSTKRAEYAKCDEAGNPIVVDVKAEMAADKARRREMKRAN